MWENIMESGHKEGYRKRDVYDSLLQQQGNLYSTSKSNTLNHKVDVNKLIQKKKATQPLIFW